MANTTSSLLAFCLLMTIVLATSPTTMATASGGDPTVAWSSTTTKGRQCRGSIAECMAEGTEFDMDSDINRRILATSQYISYGALQSNTVPCSQRGSSYYSNCQPGAQANPYTRSCSAITQCRS